MWSQKERMPVFLMVVRQAGARSNGEKVPWSIPGHGNDLAEGKGAYREVGSERRWMREQTDHRHAGLTNRNRIWGSVTAIGAYTFQTKEGKKNG